MPVDHGALLEAVSVVARNNNVTVQVKESAKAGAIAGGSCFLGALMGGPVGLVIGGVVGTSLAYMRSSNLRPLWQIISEDLSITERTQLGTRLMAAFAEIGPQDVALLAAMLMSNSNLQEKAMQVAIEFVTSQCIAQR